MWQKDDDGNCVVTMLSVTINKETQNDCYDKVDLSVHLVTVTTPDTRVQVEQGTGVLVTNPAPFLSDSQKGPPMNVRLIPGLLGRLLGNA